MNTVAKTVWLHYTGVSKRQPEFVARLVQFAGTWNIFCMFLISFFVLYLKFGYVPSPIFSKTSFGIKFLDNKI